MSARDIARQAAVTYVKLLCWNMRDAIDTLTFADIHGTKSVSNENRSGISSFIQSISYLLLGPYKRDEYRNVILLEAKTSLDRHRKFRINSMATTESCNPEC